MTSLTGPMRDRLVPYFHRRIEGPFPKKRLLLISYHFAPSTAAGALRWQKLARFVAARGWELDVITLHPTDAGHTDWERMRDLPAGTRVFGLPQPILRREQVAEAAWQRVKRYRDHWRRLGAQARQWHEQADPSPLRRSLPPLTIRTFNSFVDYEVGRRWAMDAAWLAQELGTGRPHSVVVTCGPPHQVHLAGLWLYRRTGLPFVMDMRDPWSLVERLGEPIDCFTWRMLARWYERRVAPHASLIVANTEASRDAMARRYPALAPRTVAVMNGYDDDPVPARTPGGAFQIAYAGSIYLDRDPRPLFEAAARIVHRHRLTPAEFGIHLVGTVTTFADASVTALAQQAGLQDYVTFHRQQSRRDLWTLLGQSAVLVSLPQDSHLAIPSKIFEYMQFQAWILAMAEENSATGRLLQGTPAAVVGRADVEGITARLDDWLRRHRLGELPPRLGNDPRFSRRYQAEVLFRHLEQVAR